jgi:chaperonin GroES
MIIALARILLFGSQDTSRTYRLCPNWSVDTKSAVILLGYRDNETLFTGDSAMRVRPLHDRILIERVEEEDKTTGGIIIPDTAKEKPMEGKVIAVGKGKVTEKGKVITPDVKKGDRILFSKYAGTEVKIDGKEHLIIREDDVLGIIEE